MKVFPLHTKAVYWETVTNTFVTKYTQHHDKNSPWGKLTTKLTPRPQSRWLHMFKSIWINVFCQQRHTVSSLLGNVSTFFFFSDFCNTQLGRVTVTRRDKIRTPTLPVASAPHPKLVPTSGLPKASRHQPGPTGLYQQHQVSSNLRLPGSRGSFTSSFSFQQGTSPSFNATQEEHQIQPDLEPQPHLSPNEGTKPWHHLRMLVPALAPMSHYSFLSNLKAFCFLQWCHWIYCYRQLQ